MADDRLIELMVEMLSEMRGIGANLKEFKEESRTRLERLEDQQKKTNLAIGELRLSVMKLADHIEKLVDIDQRVRILEGIVLRKAS